jgi:hypothetical protein
MLVLIHVDFCCQQRCLFLVLSSWSILIVKGTGSLDYELIQAHIGFTIHAERLTM